MGRDFLLSDWGQADYIKLCSTYFTSSATDTQNSPKRRRGMTADKIVYVNFNLSYPSIDSLLSDDPASLPPHHPDERVNYDGSFLIPTISKFTTTLYNTAAIFGRGNSSFSPKLPKKRRRRTCGKSVNQRQTACSYEARTCACLVRAGSQTQKF